MNNNKTCIKHGITLLIIMMVMGMGSAWAQDPAPGPTKSVWNGTVPSTANVSVAECNKIGITGKGTEADPYVISTAQQFAYFASKMNGNTAWWKLKENIDIDLDGAVDSDESGATHAWTYGQSNANFKGHFDGNGSTISNMKFTTNATGKNFGLFPQLTGSSATDHAYIKNLTIKDCKITTPDSGTSYGKTTITGLLVGKVAGNTDIENVTVSGCSIAYDVTTTDVNYVGALVGSLTGDNNTVKGCTVNGYENNSVTTPTTITAGTAQKKNFYVGGLVGYADSNSLITGNAVTISITLEEETSGNNYIGGLIGYAKGGNSTVSDGLPMGKRVVVKSNTVTPTITMNGQVVTASFALGGFFGYVDNNVNIINNKVTSPAISITNDIKNASYVGGAIGYINAYSYADGMTVSGGSISGPTSDKTVTNNIVFFVGGFLGYQNTSGTGVFQANKFKNVAVTGMNINLGHYIPGGAISGHKFSVGGIAGSVNAPNMRADGTWGGMPENLIFKSGKIYAPWASTSPIIGNFNAAAATHQNMTPDVVTTIDAIEKAKANTWYYNDYKLGLSDEFLNSTVVTEYNAAPTKDKFRKNYSKATETIDGIQYLAIDNSTFLRNDRYQDSERDLKTVLWWTQQANYATTGAAVTCFTANEQPIYPQSGATAAQAGNLTDYPHYMYFFQGVGNAKYASNTDAENIVKGIEANVTNDVMPAVAMASEKNLNVTITNDGETRRGFDERTLTVAVKQGSTDATSNYSFQWYLDGKADGTGTTKTLTPHWKDGQGVTVNVLDGDSKIVATASYGFAPGMLHTKASKADATAELIRSDFNTRGTSTNPYIIDCESALRQLSYLSTVHTSMFWETLGKPGTGYVANQSQGHYNRAYYELSADIDLGGREFTPISHVGYGNDTNWGTYNTNWIFQGVFDGKGQAIKNFNVTWGASQYVGNGANLYYGLFGAVGGAAATRKWGDGETSNTTIKNLIIDRATLTHNTSETSFYYDQSISTNANNCMVGVLAGIVSSNTTIQNIEIRNSAITDAGSQDYSLATKGLFAGGAIGGMQHAYGTTNTATASLAVQHIAAQVDITLTHPTFVKETDNAQINQFHIGGIIGRYYATSATKDQTQASMPAYTIYSGTVNAPKAWISPVMGSLRYSGNNNNSFGNFSRLWEGNNNSVATQLTITNALYYNFYIGTTKITDKVPSNTCGQGFRTLTAHADGTESALTYSAQKYQGVNYGASYVDIDGASLAQMNEAPFDGYNWVWSNGFVHMSTDPLVEAQISRGPGTNNFTASLTGGTPTGYRWEASFDGETWIPIPSAEAATYSAPQSLKPKSIVAFVSVGDKLYRTPVETVVAKTDLINPVVNKNGNVYSFNLNSTAPDGQMVTTYEWYQTKETPFTPAVSNADLTLTDAQMTALDGVVWCNVVVKELDVTMYEGLLLAGGKVIYVNGNNYTEHGAAAGNDDNNGLTPQTPVKTINKANSLLKTGATWDTNIIVIMGKLNSDGEFCSTGTNPATLTGKWNGKDYEGVIKLKKRAPDKASGTGQAEEDNLNTANISGKKGTHCYVFADTKFEYLTFEGSDEDNAFIECHGNDVTFGKGLIMTNFKRLSKAHGNFDGAQVVPELTIILTATNLPEADIAKYTNRTKPQVITFQSGRYGRIMGGRYTNKFFSDTNNTSHSILGSAEHPIWAIVNIDIDPDNSNKGVVTKNDDSKPQVTDGYTCDINAVIAGLTDGSMYGDFTINYHGGNVAYIVGGNQGNPVPNGTLDFTPAGGVLGKSSDKKVEWGQWPNATYFGRTVINVEQDPKCKNITVGNLYAGGLGRQANGANAKSIVDMYYYGHTEVNVKRGTVCNVYGGGAGGVMGVNPWDAHLPYATTDTDDANSAIINKVQYGDTRYGSWSSMVKGTSPFAKVRLHNLNDAGTGYVSQDLDLSNSYTTVNISGGEVNGNVYGGGYGFVQDMPQQVAMQGIGSVFGNTNINITGGNITGSVYGGSQGHSQFYNLTNNYGQKVTHIAEMNGKVNINITGTADKYPTIVGNIYGGGQGIASTASEEYLRIATTGNNDLGNDYSTDYSTDIHILIDLPDDHPFEHNIYGGGAMGLVDGSTEVVIKGGLFKERSESPVNIFGGGKGESGHPDKAKVTGDTHVVMDNNWGGSLSNSKQQDVHGNIYGGGEISTVDGNTTVHIRSGNIEGDVFGAGKGDASHPDAAAVTGKTEVIIGEK